MSSSFLSSGGALRNAFVGTSISKINSTTWSTTLFSMPLLDEAPVFLRLLFPSMVVTSQPPLLGCEKFDLQTFDVGLRQIDDAQNAFVVHAVIDGQKQHTLFHRLACLLYT